MNEKSSIAIPHVSLFPGESKPSISTCKTHYVTVKGGSREAVHDYPKSATSGNMISMSSNLRLEGSLSVAVKT